MLEDLLHGHRHLPLVSLDEASEGLRHLLTALLHQALVHHVYEVVLVLEVH